jgi:hypothetical protein
MIINNRVTSKWPHCRHSCNRISLNVIKTPARHMGAVTPAASAQPMSGVGTAAAEMQQEVAKPLCDRRSYQHAVLDNGLRVLAVQDKDAVFAAACANVQVRPLLTQRQDLDVWLYAAALCVIRTSAMAAGWLL